MTEKDMARAQQIQWVDQALALADDKGRRPSQPGAFEEWALGSLAYIAKNMMWHAQAAHWMVRLENARRHAVTENA